MSNTITQTSLNEFHIPRWNELPNVALYLDQVVTLINSCLSPILSYNIDKKENPILTKTMINNYAKNDLLPPPVKKKYSKEHVLVLIFIYYFKGVLSISDIKALLKPITEKYFSKDSELTLEDIYNEVFSLESGRIDSMKEDIVKMYQESEKTFSDADDADKDFLQKFSFICMLSYDVYVKKLMIEKIIDEMKSEK